MLSPRGIQRTALLTVLVGGALLSPRPAGAQVGPPGDPVPTVLSTGAILWTWSPASNATSYDVYYATSYPPGQVIAAVSTADYVQNGLPPNSQQAVLVVGFNGPSSGPASNFAQTFTLADVPAALAVVDVGTGTVDLSWSANGNPAGTTYGVQYSTDGVDFVTYSSYTATSAGVGGLTPQTTYLFQVTAINNAMVASAFSGLVSTRTDLVAPLTPGTPAAVVLSTGAVRWTWAGAAYATSYDVYLATQPSQLIGTVSTNTFTHNGLAPGGLSAIIVVGLDPVGAGPVSPAGSIHTFAMPPAALAVRDVSSIYAALTWSANGNSPGVVYDLQESTDGATFATYSTYTVTVATVSGLSASTSYYFEARAFNAEDVPTSFTAQVSTLTDASGGVPPPGPTGTPSASVLSTGALTWSWTAAANATGYDVYAATDAASLLAAPAGTSVTFNGLPPNTLSGVVVVGVNATGDGPLSASATAYTLAAAPSALAFSAVAATNAALSWSGGADPAGTEYDLQASTDGATFSTVVASTRTSQLLPGLTPLTTYYFQVLARNGGGAATAASASVSTETPEALPQLPGTPRTAFVSTADVAWAWSASSYATGYSVYLATQPGQLLTTVSTDALTLHGLGPNALSAIYVVGTDPLGAGPPSPAAVVHTYAAAPSTLTVGNVTSIYVGLSWGAGGNPAGTTYDLQVATDGATFVTYSTYAVLAATVSGLSTLATYYFQVRAFNADAFPTAFAGPVSTETNTLGGLPPPGRPGLPSGTALSTADVSWSWTAAANAASYRVYSASAGVLLASPGSFSVTLSSLTPNAPSGIVVQAVNATDSGPLSAPATAYTLAMVPATLAAQTVATTSIGVGWSPNGDPAGTVYELQLSTDGTDFVPQSSTTYSTAGVSGLTPGASYYFRVRAYNQDSVATGFSAVLSTTALPLTPPAPGAPAAGYVSSGVITWAWTASAGATSYELRLATDTTQLLAATTVTSATLAGYSPNDLSAVVVRGVNGTGPGTFSSSAAVHTAAAVPAGLAVAHVTSIYAALGWNAGGGGAGTRFELQVSTDGASFASYSTYSVLAATVTGLSPSTSYYFRLRALNSDLLPTAFTASVSTLTDLAGGVPPPGPAGTPAGVGLSTADIGWSWVAASSATSYRVYSASDGVTVLAAPATADFTLSGLAVDRPYGIAVLGTNPTGDGPLSPAATAYTLALAPASLSLVSASSAAVILSWSAPGDPAGITFELQKSTDGVSYATHSTYTTAAASVGGLAASATYYFQVRALNGAGVPTAFTAPVSTETFPPPPGAPGAPAAVALSSTALSWTWAPAAYAAGYRVYAASAPGVLLAAPLTNSVTFSAFTPDTVSSIVVAGVNPTAVGPLGPAASAWTLANAPTGLASVGTSSTVVSLSWGAAGNSAATRYDLQESTDGVTFADVSTYTATAVPVGGLASASTYYFRVRAANGDAVPTAFGAVVSTMTTPPLPGVPGVPTAAFVSTGSLTWSWLPSTDTLSYRVYAASDAASLLASPTTGSFTLPALTPNLVSGIVVQGVNASGLGPLSGSATAYTLAQAPAALTVLAASTGSASVGWSPAQDPAGTLYQLQTSTDGVSFSTYSTYLATAAAVPGLSPSTTYYFEVRAYNGALVPTAFSNVASTLTATPLPSAPGLPAAVALSTNDVAWSWAASSGAAGYRVFAASDAATLLASPSTASVTLSGLGPNAASALVVAGVNAGGLGPLSAPATAYTLAFAPGGLATLSVTASSARLAWASNGDPGGTSYELQRSTDGATFAQAAVTTALGADVIGLSSSTAYSFRVRALNGDLVPSTFSATASTQTNALGGVPLPGVPGAPTPLFVSTGSVAWAWAASSDAVSYDVFPASSPATLLATPASNAVTFLGMGPNLPSAIVAAGSDASGDGPLSPAATVYTYAETPGAPAFGEVDVSSLTLSWAPAGNPGGTLYGLEESLDGVSYAQVTTTTADAFALAGLSSSTAYSFRVRAFNGDGVATDYGLTSATRTLSALPGATGAPSGTALSTGGVTWSWAPAARASSYKLFVASDAATLLYFGAGAGAVFTGLAPNTPSAVVVEGVDAYGAGPLSAAATVYTLAAAPTGLTTLSVTAASVGLAWSGSGDPGGTVYEVQSSSDGVTYAPAANTTALGATVTGLSSSTAYDFKVRAENADGLYTSFSNAVATATNALGSTPLPGAPGAPSASFVSTGSVAWAWTAASSATTYQVFSASSPATLLAVVSTDAWTVLGFAPGSPSAIVVAGVDAAGPGPLSPSATVYAYAAAPSGLGVVSVASGAASLAWSANGNAAQASYEVQAATDGVTFSSAAVVSGPAALVLGLSSATAYAFKVRAENGDGVFTTFSNAVSTRTAGIAPPGAPGTPAALSVSTGSVAWAWDAVAGAAGYDVYAASAAALLGSPAAPALSFVGMAPNTPSVIAVAGRDGAGDGPLSAAATAYTLAAAPSGLAAAGVTATSVDLAWSAAGNPGGTGYEVQASTDGATFAPAAETTALAASLAALSSATAYSFRVRAKNGAGVFTGYANLVSTRTNALGAAPLPGACGTPAAAFVSTGSLAWTWSASSNAVSYKVFPASSPATLLAAPATNAFTLLGLTPDVPSGIVVLGVDAAGEGPLSAAATVYSYAAAPAALAAAAVYLSSASLAWSADGNPAGVVYALEDSLDGVTYNTVTTTTAAGFTVTGLSSATVYDFRARAFNSDLVASPYSNVVSTQTQTLLPGPPGAPAGVALSTNDVSWSWAPAAKAASYAVYAASDALTVLASTGGVSVTLTGLGVNAPSAIVVAALNAAGQGPLSSSATAYTLALPPTSLTTLSVTATSVDLAWTAPGDPGGTSYQVQAATDGVTFVPAAVTTALGAAVPGLSSATAYSFRVRAQNGGGVYTAFSNTDSTATNSANGQSLPGLPGTPATSFVSTGSIAWTWTASSGATSYQVSPASSPATVLAAPTTNAVTFAGLAPDVPSAIVVLGVNGVGDGPLSPSATAYSLAAPPAALAFVSVSSAAASLTWSADGNPGGAVYELQEATDGVTFAVYSTYTATGATAFPLAASSSYTFRLRAYNGSGVATAFAGPVSTATYPPPPGAAGTPTAVVSSTGDIAWTWPAASDAAAYRVYVASAPSLLLATPATNALALSGLAPNTTSGLVVQAVNPSGLGPLSASATAFTLAMPPAALTLVSASSAALSVSWSANGDPAGTPFELQKATDGVTFTVHSTYTGTAATLFPLAPGTPYQLRLRAFNGAGVATAFTATLSTQTAPAPPGTPGAPAAASVSTGSIVWSWTPAPYATSYLVYPASSTAAALAAPATDSYTAGGLGPNVPSAIAVAGVNATGTGPLSPAATVYTWAEPPTALALTAFVSSTTVQLGWNPNGNPAGTVFELQKATDGVTFAVHSTYTASAAALTSLAAQTTYSFRLRAYNGSAVATAFSNVLSTETLPPLPGLPGTPAPTALSTADILFTWTPSAYAAGYLVYPASAPTSLLAAPPTASLTLSGLAPNASAALVVAGVDATGVGPLSAAATGYTLAMPPAALAVVGASSSTASLSWSANGDPAGTVYELQKATDGVTFAVHSTYTATAAALTGLSASTTYTFRLRAYNGANVATAYASPASTQTWPPPPGAPGTPTGVVLSTGAVSWSWTPAANAAAYRVYAASDAATILASVTTTTAVLNGLLPNSASGIVVAGGNPTGFGPLTAPATHYTFAMPPAALTVTGVTSNSAGLAWSADGNPGGTTYQVQAATDGVTFGAAATVASPSATLLSLSSFTAYSFRVRAVNGEGVATAFSNVASTATTPAPVPLPGAPGAPVPVGRSTGSVSWSWTAAANATSYDVFAASSPSTLLAAPAVNSVSFAGLGPNAPSGIVVAGADASGLGPLSASATAYTLAAVPGTPAFTEVDVTSVTLAWSVSGNPPGTPFELQLSTNGSPFVTVATVTAGAFTVMGLSSTTPYAFQVRAYDGDLIATAFSAAASTVTQSPLPAAPGTPAAVVLSTADIVWSWAPAYKAASYKVYPASNTAVLLAAPATTFLAFGGMGPNSPSAIAVRGTDPAGDGPLASAATAYTFAMPPAALSVVSAGSAAVSLAWSAAGNPAGTLYELQLSTDGVDYVSYSTYAVAGATAAGLAPSTSYAFQVRALNGGLVPTAFAAAVSTRTAPPAPVQPGTPAGTALGVSSISWTWAGAAYAAGYVVYPASAPASALGSAPTTAYIELGLAPDATASVLVAGVDPSGLGPQSSSAPAVYTLAFPPAGTAVGAVYATSATLSWGLDGNPAGVTAEVQASTDGVSFAQAFLAPGVSATLQGLLICTSYYARVRDWNGSSIPTAFDAARSFLTAPATPTAAGGLSAAAQAGDRIALTWNPSPSEGVTQYRVYWDSGTGTVSYSTPLAVVPSSVTSFLTGVLASSASYRFALRAYDRCGLEEGNVNVAAAAPAVGSLGGVSAFVSAPQSGSQVEGNSLTVAAQLALGAIAQTASVRFQYKASTSSAWADIPSADPANPNPKTAAPYFVHWDADALAVAAAQQFDLRAVATTVSGSSDPAPGAVTVTVLPPAAPGYDVSESAAGSVVTKTQGVNNAVSNSVASGGAGTGAALTAVTLPAGALATSSATLTIVSNPTAAPPAPAGAQGIGVTAQLALSNGQTLLSGGHTAAVTLSYPDSSDTGVIDGTTLRADRLVMYSAESAAGPWTRDFTSSVDVVHHTVTGNTPHFSFFALFVAAAPDLSTLRVYPVPYRPNGGNPDFGVPYSPGNPNSGIVFDDLPDSVTIKIYTVTGQRVVTLGSGASGGKLQWDVRNDRGHDVASGGYVAVITSPGNAPVTRKLLIIR